MKPLADSFFGILNHFRLIEERVPVDTFLDEIAEGRKKSFYDSKGKIHPDSHHIFLRGVVINNRNKDFFIGDILENVQYLNYLYFPKITEWMKNFSIRHRGSLGRVYISFLKPHGHVVRHADRGIYYAAKDRYHLVIKSRGTEVFLGSQSSTFQEGEVWWISNKVPHEIFNNYDEERVHLVFDLLPGSFFRRIRNIILWVYFTMGRRLKFSGLRLDRSQIIGLKSL